ncbi:MAG: DUF2073 domain-containing protein [Nanoarchaeota archaeon]|nr:DUF2073 domain-containing protein [Nanoarchaeota archaeon]
MLTLQFIPYAEIQGLSSGRRTKKLLDAAKQNKIVLLQGRLTKQEEADLIQKTMEQIDDKFKGIELSVIAPGNMDGAWHEKVKQQLLSLLMGDREGFTIIGPATIVKEIRKDPHKIQLLMKDKRKR